MDGNELLYGIVIGLVLAIACVFIGMAVYIVAQKYAPKKRRRVRRGVTPIREVDDYVTSGYSEVAKTRTGVVHLTDERELKTELEMKK